MSVVSSKGVANVTHSDIAFSVFSGCNAAMKVSSGAEALEVCGRNLLILNPKLLLNSSRVIEDLRTALASDEQQTFELVVRQWTPLPLYSGILFC